VKTRLGALSANNGHHHRKTPGFLPSNSQAATNSELADVNFVVEVKNVVS
jgi:hypothetical protein